MMAVIFAVVLLLWIVAQVQLKLLRRLMPSATHAQHDVYLVVALLATMLLFSGVLYFSLPGSVLSAGWTQDQLEGFWRWALSLQFLTLVTVFLNSRLSAGLARFNARPVVPASGHEIKKSRKAGGRAPQKKQ